jgi:hypothetical protein
MKYRIKETINGNDVSTFTVQYKLFWWWNENIPFYNKEVAEYWIGFLISKSKKKKVKEVKYHTVEQ